MSRALLLLLGCKACSSCTPDIPDPPPEHSEEEDSQPQDSTESEPFIDTAPPPPCDQPEVEPNGNASAATAIEMESWACGDFDGVDVDMLSFEMAEDGWLMVDIDAAVRGSPANVLASIESSAGETASALRDADSVDPMLVVPVEADSWTVRLNEAQLQSGPEYTWQLLASITKRPVVWTHVEPEDHSDPADAMVIEDGMAIFGNVDAPSNFDWYVLETPPGKHTIRVDVVAMSEGSPLNPRLQLYFPASEAEKALDPDQVVGTYDQVTLDSDPDSASPDPHFTRTSEGGETWYFKLRHTPSNSTGSLYWYLLEVEIE